MWWPASPPPRRAGRCRRCDGVEDQRRPAQPGAPVPVGASRNQRGDEWGIDRLRFARGRRWRPLVSPSAPDAVRRAARWRATSWPPWAASRPRWPPAIRRRAGGASASTTSCVVREGDLLHRADPPGLPPAGPASTVELASGDQPPPSACRCTCRARSSTPGQAEWAVGGYDDPAGCAGGRVIRALIADPDLVAGAGAPARPSASGRAPAATRRARCRDARTPGRRASASRRAESATRPRTREWYAPAARGRAKASSSSAPGRPALETRRLRARARSAATTCLGRLIEQVATTGGRSLAVAGSRRGGPSSVVVGAPRAPASASMSSQRATDVPDGGRCRAVRRVGRRPREYEIGAGAACVDAADVRRGDGRAPRRRRRWSCSTRSAADRRRSSAEQLGSCGPRAHHPGQHRRQRSLRLVTVLRTRSPARPNVAQHLALAACGSHAAGRTCQADGRGEVTVRDRFTGLDQMIPCAAVAPSRVPPCRKELPLPDAACRPTLRLPQAPSAARVISRSPRRWPS